ncbi:hypothetical protein KY284_027882 [Solanum tuberosum]|nr:hypothetical protein KY284_027882 [Solanum tuberosum]
MEARAQYPLNCGPSSKPKYKSRWAILVPRVERRISPVTLFRYSSPEKYNSNFPINTLSEPEHWKYFDRTATHLRFHRYSLLFLSNSLCFLAKLQVAFFTESNNTFVFKHTLPRKACQEMSCNQPNKLSRTEEQTLKEPPSVNIQENASNQITTSTCSSNKAKQLFPPFYAFEKGSTSNTCKPQQNAIPEVIYILASTSNACSEQQNLTPKVATRKGLDQRVYNLPSASEVKFNNMFCSKPHSLAPPPDSPSRIEESFCHMYCLTLPFTLKWDFSLVPAPPSCHSRRAFSLPLHPLILEEFFHAIAWNNCMVFYCSMLARKFHVYQQWQSGYGLEVSSMKSRKYLQPGSSIPVYGTSLPSVPISMDLVGLRYFEVDFSKSSRKPDVDTTKNVPNSSINDGKNNKIEEKNGFIIPVVIDVSIQRYTKMVQLYSTVIVSNATSVPLEVRFDIPFGISPKVLHPIYPAQQFPLQVHLLLKLSSDCVDIYQIH